MDARLQRRIQRYGWDLAVTDYVRHWHALLAGVQADLVELAAPAVGEDVLDVACGAGAVTAALAQAVGPAGRVLGVDLSQAMVDAAGRHLQHQRLLQASTQRMDAEQLMLPDASFDLVVCALGLMYLPDPDTALREFARVLRPGGRVALAVWGERERCAWASMFGIVDDEVRSEVCPLFFALGQGEALAQRCAAEGLEPQVQRRRADVLSHRDGDAACAAALSGGPVALAWSRFDGAARERVRSRYLASIDAWRVGPGYGVPAEYVLVVASHAQGSGLAPESRAQGEHAALHPPSSRSGLRAGPGPRATGSVAEPPALQPAAPGLGLGPHRADRPEAGGTAGRSGHASQG